MTNKPMLSVERELLESMAAYVADSPNAVIRARSVQLRALLDKPASPQAWGRDMDYRPEELGSPETEPACRTCNDTKMVDDGELTHSAVGILYECGPIKCVKDCPDCKPAAQHRCDPVCAQIRYRRPEKGCPDWGDWHDLKLCRFDENRTHYIDSVGWECETRALFAEQPAPVAVVMPDDWEDQLFEEMSRRFDLRKHIDDDHMVYDDTQIGVEFARDWIKARLNGVKP